jgi:transcriptional regulator with XRE-family HTH domain
MDNDEDLLYALIGERVRDAREKQKDISQERLGRAVGMTRTSINNIENGRQRTTISTLWKIAAAVHTEARLLIPLREEYEREQTDPAELKQRVTDLVGEIELGSRQARLALVRLMRRMELPGEKPE